MRKRSLKKQSPEAKEELQRTIERDFEFYEEIWRERPHVCYETGEPIYGELCPSYFHHVLPKYKYPQYRYTKENIVVLSAISHNKAEMNLRFTPKTQELYLVLLEKHNTFGDIKN